jgi:hypothetical protein
MTFRLFRIPGVLLVSFSLSLQLASAFDTELSDTAVREAYFLGQRHDDKAAAFLANYSKHLPLPKKGPYISEIRLLTPLAQVVEMSIRQTTGYSAQQALLDYRGRGDSILLEIHIEFTPTYNQLQAEQAANSLAGEKGTTLRTEDFWQDFRYGLKQKQQWVEPRSMHGEPIYGRSDAYSSGGLIGAWVFIEYDARNVLSDDAEVHIFLPDDQDATGNFDLSKLR